MAWSDEPTQAQIAALFNLIRWEISREEMPKIERHLRTYATRQELSNELGRLRELKISRKLNKDNAFESDIWAGYREEE